jgi:uncharacterized repeat protein (TIGR02543 family)
MKHNRLKKFLVVGMTTLLAVSQVNYAVFAEEGTQNSSGVSSEPTSAPTEQVIDNNVQNPMTIESSQRDTQVSNASSEESALPIPDSSGETNTSTAPEQPTTEAPMAVFDGVKLNGTDDKVLYNTHVASTAPQTLTINLKLEEKISTDSIKLEIKLANGLGFSTIPGMVATDGKKNNWKFNSGIADPAIMNATYTPNEKIHGIYQPQAGTLVYDIVPTTKELTVSVTIVSDRSLNVLGDEETLTLDNAISVSHIENGATINNEVLEHYSVQGPLHPAIYSSTYKQSLVLEAGESGNLQKEIIERTDKTAFSAANLFVEKLDYTFKVDKGAGIVGLKFAQDPDAATVTIDRDSSTEYDYVRLEVGPIIITPKSTLEFEYKANEDAEPGSFIQRLESGKITANGKTFEEKTNYTGEAQKIYIVDQSNVQIVPPVLNTYVKPNFEGDVTTPLGGFAITNIGLESAEKKMQLKFDDPSIGVQGVTLPFETENTAAIKDIVVKTNKGQEFTIASINAAQAAKTYKMNEIFGFSRYDLYLADLGTVAADEYITEVTYVMGKVEKGANATGIREFKGAENMRHYASMYVLAVSYYGRLLSTPASKRYSAVATIVDADKEFSDESAHSATNVMNVNDTPSKMTFLNSVSNINSSSVPLAAGSTKTITATLGMSSYPYTLSSPSITKGFDLYIRAGEYFKINTDTIVITYEGRKYEVAKDDLVMTTDVDNKGMPVYKVELPDMYLGYARPNSGTPFTINISYDVKVKANAPTTYVPANELLYVSPKGLTIPASNGGNSYFNCVDKYDVNKNGVTDKETLGTLSSRYGIQISEQKDFRVTTAANLNDGPWVSYDFDTNAEIIDLNPNGKAKYQLTVANNSGGDVKGYTALIPIPKTNEKVNELTPASEDQFNSSLHLQKKAFTWTASLLQEIQPAAGSKLNYEILYATSYEIDKDSTNFKPWSAISNKNDIRMVKIVSKSVIKDDFKESIDFEIALTDPEADKHAGNTNIYSARIYREMTGSAGYKPSEPIAIRLQTGVVSGQVFNDTNYNGVKDASESGHNGVTVKAYEAGSNPPKLIGTSVTKTINGKDGCYEFLGLSKLKNVDIVFVNPATNGEFRFSPTTNGGSMPTPAAGHTEAKISNFTPSSTGYNKMDAGLIAPVTITLNAGDGSTAEDKLSRYPGEKIETKPTAELEGHTFQGWFTEEKAGTEISFPYTAGKQNTTFYAHYRANSYKVNYHNEDQTETKEVVYGKLLKEPTKPSKTGQTFIGWFTEPTGGRAWNFDEETMPANDIDLYARFGTAVHDVTFDTGSHTTKQTYEYNSLLEKPTNPVKKGHTFKGWFTAQTGGREWDFTQDKMPDNDLTLYARFDVNNYLINYVVEDAVAKTETVPYNSLLTQPADPDKEGYALTGWFDEETGVQWDFAKDKVPDKNVTLLARFTKKTYQLTFDNDGQQTIQEVVFDELAVEPTTPVKVGYTFVGWYDEAGNQWDFSVTKMPSQNKTLTARYTINRYTVTFDDKGIRTTEEVTYDSLLTKPADPQAAAGYAFVGWQEQTNQTLWEFATDKMPANDVLLIAQFEALDQEITLDFNGGTSEGPDHITAPTDSEVNIDAIVQPTKPGYQFVGWFNGDDQVNGVITMPVGGLELKAKWEEADQVIRFDANGGTGVDSVVAKTNTVITIDDYTTTRAGYDFLGWFDENEQHVTGAFTVPAGGATFTAKWKALDQTITFDVNGGDLATQPAPIVQPTDAKVKLDVLRKPERTGYIFIGWYDAAGKKYSGTIKMPVGGLALIAKWEDEPVVPEKEQDSPTTTNNKEKNPSSKDKTTTKNKKKSTKTEKTPTKKNTKEKALPKSGAQMSPFIGLFGLVLVVCVLIIGIMELRRQRLSKYNK